VKHLSKQNGTDESLNKAYGNHIQTT